MKKWFLIFLTGILMMTGCASTANSDTKRADMSGYENLKDSEHVFVETDIPGFLNRLDNQETFVAYFGFVGCPWCAELVPLLNEEAKESDINTVYYINTRPNADVHKNTEMPNYDQLFAKVGDFFSYNNDGEHQLYVPFLFFVKNGKIVSTHEGTVEGHDAHDRKMNEEEVQSLRETLKNCLEGLKE